MTKPLVSVVTPTLNRSELLAATLASVRSQTYSHVEHIVVDGGSTDGTVELLADAEVAHGLRWVSEPDRGMYDAVNKGLRMARGEIVAYLNSDDLYFPWTIEVVVEALERRADVDFVYGDALSVDDTTGVRRVYWQYPFHLDTVRRTSFLAQPTVFWRRRVLETVGGFDDTLRYVADCDFWMRAGSSFRFHKEHELLAIERDHASSFRGASHDAVWTELAQVRARYVTLHGWRHRVAHARSVRREQLLERVYSLLFLGQSRLPPQLRRRWWRHFLAADGSRPDARAVLRLLLPDQPGVRHRVLKPSRRWLEPSG